MTLPLTRNVVGDPLYIKYANTDKSDPKWDIDNEFLFTKGSKTHDLEIDIPEKTKGTVQGIKLLRKCQCKCV